VNKPEINHDLQNYDDSKSYISKNRKNIDDSELTKNSEFLEKIRGYFLLCITDSWFPPNASYKCF